MKNLPNQSESRSLPTVIETIQSQSDIISTKKTVVVLPATRWQIPLVKRLKIRGYRVVVFDLYENQPACKYADDSCIVDILDKERVLQLARENHAEAIMSDECDIATPTIAWVSERLGKPSIGIKLAELYTNKFAMRVFGASHGFDTPMFYKCPNIDSAVQAFQKVGRKMIMKPLDSNSSRGIYSICSEQDISKYFDKSLSYSKTEKAVLLEEYIDGEEFSIDGLKVGNKFYPLAISQKIHFPYNENLDQALIFTYDGNGYDYDLLRETNERFVMESDLAFGLTHAEYKFSDGKYYLIEIGARGGGNLISSIINPFMTGIETQELLIDWALGNGVNSENINYTDNIKCKCSWLHFFDTKGKEGILKEIKGIEILESCESIKSYHFFYDIGNTIGKAKDGGTRLGYCIVCCESFEELQKIQKLVNESVEIVLN